MSHFATPFIVINLGCEMLYVIEQRLKAQKIETDKSNKVLTDIATVLLHQKLLDELFTPQPVATHIVIKQLLQDISAVSIMKLDEYSMNKLWDLMTMIFKWQLSLAKNQNIFDITRRHLKGVAIAMPQYFPRSIIEQTMTRFESLAHRFTDADYNCLRNTMILWFSEYHTKISVLLRLGLQRKDGTFNLPANINPKILEKLGENIYKYDSKKNPVAEYESKCADTHEINCLLGAVDNASSTQNVFELELPLKLHEPESKKKIIALNQHTAFTNIDTNVKCKSMDLNYTPDIPKTPQEDLLQLLNSLQSE